MAFYVMLRHEMKWSNKYKKINISKQVYIQNNKLKLKLKLELK